MINGYSFAEKNATDAKADKSCKTIGTHHVQFKGYRFGINQKTKKIVLAVGGKDVEAQGFSRGPVDANIRGKRPHHKGFIFSRISDPEDVLILAGQYLDDCFEFHHELTEKNFLMLCDTSS